MKVTAALVTPPAVSMPWEGSDPLGLCLLGFVPCAGEVLPAWFAPQRNGIKEQGCWDLEFGICRAPAGLAWEPGNGRFK